MKLLAGQYAALFFIFFAFAFIAQAEIKPQEYNTIFFRANNAYREENYDAAIQDYEELINAGIRGANIYYNLGNAYLRTDNKGKAILYYERAFRMRPRDADIRANLKFARTLVESGAQQTSPSWYNQVLFFLHGFLSANEMVFLASALYFAIIALFALGIWFRGWRRFFFYTAFVFCFLSIILLPSLIMSIYESESQNRAVIMADEAAARFGPDDNTTIHFTLYEGAVVRITRTEGDWHQVKRSDGKMGWLRSTVFSII